MRLLRSDMGLMITHHHAEPLGAEMFLRAYPDLEPSYLKHKDLFEGIMKDATDGKRTRKSSEYWLPGTGRVPFWKMFRFEHT